MTLSKVSDFSETARNELIQLLADVPGKKNLVIQKSLVGPIELLVKFTTLQDQGVDRVFYLENDNVDSSQKNILFIVNGEKAQHAQAVASQITRLRTTASTDHEYSIFWVPRRTLVADKVLEAAGVLGDVTSSEWPLYFHSLESDLLSMELDDSFGELYLRGDPTSIFLAAKALDILQRDHGLFPRILGKGVNAKRLCELLLRAKSDATDANGHDGGHKRAVASMPSLTMENLIIIDRGVDLATPLMTQLTYEGLIDELFHIKNSQTEVNSSIVGGGAPTQTANTPGAKESLNRKLRLDGTDKLYEQLRDSHFATVGGILNKVARRLQTDFEGRHGDKSVAELKEFVKKLPGYQTEQHSLKTQTNLAEEVMKQTRTETFSNILFVQQNTIAGTDIGQLGDQIEDLIARKIPLQMSLRLLCLCSVLGNGLRQKDLDNFRRQIVHAYGYEHLSTLDALDKMQLLQLRGGLTAFSLNVPSVGLGGGKEAADAQRTDYAAARRLLQLIVDEVSDQDPQDTAYVFSGYAPLSVRLVQAVLQKQRLAAITKTAAAATLAEPSSGWRGFDDALKSVKGPSIDEAQIVADKSSKARQVLAGHAGRKTCVVFFLGGITFAEIAALRLIARQERERRDILICTTGITSGDKMMQAAMAG